MLDSIYHFEITLFKHRIFYETIKIWLSSVQHHNDRHHITLLNWCIVNFII